MTVFVCAFVLMRIPSCICDCVSVPDGSAFLDDCDECSGGHSGHAENSDMDCTYIEGQEATHADACFGDVVTDCVFIRGGDAAEDACGECNGNFETNTCSTYAMAVEWCDCDCTDTRLVDGCCDGNVDFGCG